VSPSGVPEELTISSQLAEALGRSPIEGFPSSHRQRRSRMAFQGRYLFTASMDVDPEKEALFNEVYDTEHVPLIKTVPGLIAAARFKTEPLTMIIGGERKTIVAEHEPRYSAMYELESPEVLLSEAWAKVVDAGRWPGQVRPYTKNRRHVLYRRLEP
jgi:hypothetical protein